MYVGKCAKKSWTARPVGSAEGAPLSEDDAVGSISMSAKTRSLTGFAPEEVAHIRAALPQSAEIEVEPFVIRIKLEGAGGGAIDIERYTTLLKALSEHLLSADKVVLSVKKQACHTHTVRFGDKG